MRPEIRAALKAQEFKLTDRWAELDFGSPDGAYMAMRLSADAFARANPFLLLADGVAGAREHMDLETLIVVGALFNDGGQGFYVLSRRADGLVPAHGEDLLDPGCRLATGAK